MADDITVPDPPYLPGMFAAQLSRSKQNTKQVRLKDPREGGNLSGTYPEAILQQIISKALEQNIDPYTALAIAMQETGAGTAYGKDGGSLGIPQNPMRVVNPEESFNDYGYKMDSQSASAYDQLPYKDRWSAIYDIARQRNLMYALQRLRERTLAAGPDADEARKIQAYNGLGKINTNTYANGPMYGGQNGTIDMGATSLYGKRVIDIRDNMLKNDPTIQRMIASAQPQRGFNPLEPLAYERNISADLNNRIKEKRRAMPLTPTP